MGMLKQDRMGFPLFVSLFILCLVCSDVIVAKDLRIGAFNVQIFGTAKMKDKEVKDVLVKILLRYDLVLLQEIRDASQTAVLGLLEAVNRQSSSEYLMVVSKRLGTSKSKEQYAFFYKKTKFSVLDSEQWPEDNGKMFERPPFTVVFKAWDSSVKKFAFMGIHTKPKAAVAEMNNLVKVFDSLSNKWNLKEFIIGGDLNAGCTYVKDWQGVKLRQDQRFTWVISDKDFSTTGSTKCPYDRFILAGESMRYAYKRGSGKVYNFKDDLKISQSLTGRVSDHYPVEMSLLEVINI